MKIMIINTSSVKITPEMNSAVITICRERRLRRSDFFVKSITKAARAPYSGVLGIKKLCFTPSKNERKTRIYAKPRYRTIGARVSPELKAELKAICKKYSISESQFSRWALNAEILFYRQKKTANPTIRKCTKPLGLFQPHHRSPIQQMIDRQQKLAFEYLQTANKIDILFGLIAVAHSGFVKR